MRERYVRLSDFPIIGEIREEYISLREKGNGRKIATEQLMASYYNELATGTVDDGVFFWIGLADAQFSKKELTDKSARKGLASLDIIERTMRVAPSDIQRRKKWYSQAPMPERKIRPKKKFKCSWNIGDTFALRLKGDVAEAQNISGKYVLLRKVSCVCFDGNEIPLVTVSFWDSLEKPSTEKDVYNAHPLRLKDIYMGPIPMKFQYRAEILFENQQQVTNANLEYIGSFPNVKVYDDEIIIKDIGHIVMILPDRIAETCSIFYMRDKSFQKKYKKTEDGSKPLEDREDRQTIKSQALN